MTRKEIENELDRIVREEGNGIISEKYFTNDNNWRWVSRKCMAITLNGDYLEVSGDKGDLFCSVDISMVTEIGIGGHTYGIALHIWLKGRTGGDFFNVTIG